MRADTTGATFQADEPFPDCVYPSDLNSVWYRVTAPADAALAISTAGSRYDTALGLWTGSALAELRELGCGDYTSGTSGYGARARALVPADGVVLVQVIGEWSETGSLLLNASLIDRPANDAIAQASEIVALPFGEEVDLDGSTIEPGEPVGCRRLSGSVWYRYTATEPGRLHVRVGSTSYYASWNIFEGATAPVTSLGCDYGRSELDAVAGSTYWLQVGDSDGGGGYATVDLTLVVIPPNDRFDDAIDLGLDEPTIAKLAGSSLDPDEQTCGWSSGTVWYRYAATTTSPVEVDVDRELFRWRPYVAVYTWTPAGLTQIACSDGAVSAPFADLVFTHAPMTFAAKAGQEYFIQMGDDFWYDDIPDRPIELRSVAGVGL